MQVVELIHEGIHGYFIPLDHPAVDILQRHGVIGHYKSAIKKGYPELFDEFWLAYHKDRRTGKKEAFKAWIKLSAEDKANLPKAARAYTDFIIVESSPQYMKHPKRFIDSGAYEDYLTKNSQSKIIAALRYWDVALKGSTGFSLAWKQADRSLAVEDIRQLSPELWQEKVWIFFSGRDPLVEIQKSKLGLHYKTFHSMLTKELLTTKVKKPVPCRYCGELAGRHDPGCPLLLEKKKKQELIDAEIRAAKAQDFDLKAAFNKEIGR